MEMSQSVSGTYTAAAQHAQLQAVSTYTVQCVDTSSQAHAWLAGPVNPAQPLGKQQPLYTGHMLSLPLRTVRGSSSCRPQPPGRP
jgi:hypothetical protein